VQSPVLHLPAHLPLRLLLHLCAGIDPLGPCGLDQLFESGTPRVFQRSDLDVTHSLARTLEQVMRVIELPPEKKSKSDAVL
jgi:hypothetical protein